MAKKYHVALSFAGEDRAYVGQVADALQASGADVFYDKFEEADLWGKDLYAHLSDIYQNRAVYTVIFISEAYGKKLWTNHERRSAQARAFSESQEYILPAFFDEAIEVPGLLKTVGYIALEGRPPSDVAALIVQKLKKGGVRLKQTFAYSADAKADVDFTLKNGDRVSELILAMKTYTWPKQNPAVRATLALDWNSVSADQAFVLGRNLYQCADGNERRAVALLDNLRSELAKITAPERALDLLNGMLFEVYFNSAGEFRKGDIKKRHLESLLVLQTAEKYAPSIGFIQRALEPYRDDLPLIPSTSPQPVVVQLELRRSSSPVIRSLKVGERNLLHKDQDGDSPDGRVWRLSFRKFTIGELKKELADAWGIPHGLLSIEASPPLDPLFEFGVPEGHSIRWRVPVCPRAT